MSLISNVRWRPVPPPGEGPTERHIEHWRVLRCTRRGTTYDWLIGLKPETATVSQSSQIVHTDPHAPVVQTASGRRYHLIGPPASVGACSFFVETCLTTMRAEFALRGGPHPIDVTSEYWTRWRDANGDPNCSG